MYYRENGQFKVSYRADQQVFPILQDRVFMIGLLVFALAIMPFVASDYLFRAIINPVLILALAAIGLNLLVGYCGQISLGAAALMGIGAYMAYNIGVRLPGLNFLVLLVLAGASAALVGVIFGTPSLRIKGLYLAVATLAAQFFTDWVFARVKWFVNYNPSGVVTMPDLELFGWKVASPSDKYLFLVVIVIVLAMLAKNLARGQIGRAWMATRDMDVAAEVIGIRPVYAKLTAFAVSSFYLGVAGALWGSLNLGSWDSTAFNLNFSLTLLFMIIIGGLGSILGAFLGAAFMMILPIVLNQIPGWFGIAISAATLAHIEAMVFGSLIVFFLIVEPHGLARLWSIGKEKMRLWPFPH